MSRTRIGWIIAAVFALALFMGAGPGVEIVNEPKFVELGFGLSLPWIYAWGILWYLVEAACVVAAYFLLWRNGDDGDEVSR